MVDQFGRWSYEPNTPAEKKCDMDYIADYIVSQSYVPKTDIENVALMIILHFENELENNEWDWFTFKNNWIDDVIAFVEASGGLREFDWEA